MADEKQKMVSVDVNTLELSEQLDIEAGVDAFAPMVPPPDGIYLASLRLGRDGWKQGQSKSGQTFLMAAVDAVIAADGALYDGQVVFDNASTMVMRSGRSRVDGILEAAGRPIHGSITVSNLAKLFNSFLAGDPQVKVETKWRAYCAACNRTVKSGSKSFPINGKGQPSPVVECPQCHAEVTAQAKIVRYLPLGGQTAPSGGQTGHAGGESEAAEDLPF